MDFQWDPREEVFRLTGIFISRALPHLWSSLPSLVCPVNVIPGPRYGWGKIQQIKNNNKFSAVYLKLDKF